MKSLSSPGTFFYCARDELTSFHERGYLLQTLTTLEPNSKYGPNVLNPFLSGSQIPQRI